MKQFILVLLLFSSFNLWSQSYGIHFLEDDWDAAVALAKAENKLIFVDGHTSWCAPCRIMEEYVFTDPACGDLYNSKFINLKLDMEKGVGPLFGLRYGVSGYPTFLFLTSDGTLVHKYDGYRQIDDVVSEGKSALQPYRYESAMQKRYAGGDRLPDFLYNYTYFKKDRGDASYIDIIPQYLDAQKNWSAPDAVRYIFEFSTAFGTPTFDYMANNRQDYIDVLGADAFNTKFDGIVQAQLEPGGVPVTMQERKKIYLQAYPENGHEMHMLYALDFYKNNGQDSMYAETAYAYFIEGARGDEKTIRELIPFLQNNIQRAEIQTYVENYKLKQAEASNDPASWQKLAEEAYGNNDYVAAKKYAARVWSMAKQEKATKKQYKKWYKKFLKKIK